MLLHHSTLRSSKVRCSDQHLGFEIGKRRIEFICRASGIKGRASGDSRNREKIERHLWSVGQEKRYAILLADADGTQRTDLLLYFSAKLPIRERLAIGCEQG
jgi:hypothetical protein